MAATCTTPPQYVLRAFNTSASGAARDEARCNVGHRSRRLHRLVRRAAAACARRLRRWAGQPERLLRSESEAGTTWRDCSSQPGFAFAEADIVDAAAIERVFAQQPIDKVVHLAAQAGVRHSITHPQDYIDSNLTGFLNILQAYVHVRCSTLCTRPRQASMAATRELPFSESDRVDRPVSLYAATKRANELMAYVYSLQFGVPATGLRFFTVYGPWGRPDMATFRFTQAIVAGQPIDVYNHGDMRRDFTYIDDIAEGVVRVLDRVPAKGADGVQHRVLQHRQSPLRAVAAVHSKFSPTRWDEKPRCGSCRCKWATSRRLSPISPSFPASTGGRPTTSIDVGLPRFVQWYEEYYGQMGRSSERTAIGGES